MGEMRRVVLIAGPTASGKSALAIEKARALGGVVVNADSMQVYDVLSVVTARPQPDELAEVPHRLYGFVTPDVRFSTGGWLNAVHDLINETAAAAIPLVFVGGTGLYFDALLNGVAAVPEIAPEFVQAAEADLDGLDRAGRGALLAARDPLMAPRIAVPDRQRVARALSVLAATGRSLAEWQDDGQAGLLDGFAVERLVIDPQTDVLRERIARRFAAMMDAGAVDEVARLMALGIAPDLPVMKAIGVREIAAWQAGEIEREEAVMRAVIASRQYAKRQRTWLRNRMGGWPRIM